MGGILARSSWLEAALIAICLACAPALAQAPITSAGENGKTGPAPAAKPAPRSDQQVTSPPSPDVLVMLVRNTLIAFNQANLTGDYAVLLALGAPDFQKNNDRAKLSEQFASFREQKIDVSPVAVLPPQFVRRPRSMAKGFYAWPVFSQANRCNCASVLPIRWSRGAGAMSASPSTRGRLRLRLGRQRNLIRPLGSCPPQNRRPGSRRNR